METQICQVYWDNSAYQLSNPNNNYTIEPIQGVAFKLIWDSGEHIINNPQNYSYSFLASGNDCENLRIWYYFVDARGRGRENSIDIRGKFMGFSAIQNPTNPPFFFPLVNCRALYTNPCENQEFRQFPLTTRSNPVSYLRTERSGVEIPNDTIKIVDDGVEYFYPINDTNSVEVINSNGGNNIIIEGHSFPINNVDSARKECNNQCPFGTRTCTCNLTGVTCCYQLINGIWKVVKSFRN